MPHRVTVGEVDYPDWPLETQSRWLVNKPIKKVFFLRTPEPLGP